MASAGTNVTEDDIESFLTALRAGDIDRKVNLIQLWGVKLATVEELPERAIDAITLLVGPFVRSPAHLLVTSTLTSFLPSFLPLLPPTSSQQHIRLAVSHMLPGLIEKLNDPKDKIHVPARDCIGMLGGKAYACESLASSQAGSSRGKEKDGVVSLWEAAVKDALGGRGARAKLELLKLLLQMRDDPSVKLPLKPWISSLVSLLEDSDGAVRDQARETAVALLSPPSTPPAARAEFKKLLIAHNVRKSIADGILARVLGGVSAPPTPAVGRQVRPESAESARVPTPASEDVDIVYIASARDLDNEFKTMIPLFSGKETEHNWGPREQAIIRIRGMLRGQVFTKQPDAFLVGLKSGIVEGVSKTMLSLRTTVAQQSCALVQELAEYLGSAFDPSVEILLPTLGKMAGLTKRIIAERSQKAVVAIIQHSTVHPRILIAHIGAATADKSVQTRQYGTAHLKTFLESAAAKNPSNHEATPGLVDQLEQTLKRCLGDINPVVREQARSAFWSFERLFPQVAASIIASLDGTAKRQLERANQRHDEEKATTSTTKAASVKPRASSSMSALIAAKRAKVAAERAQAAAASAPVTVSNQSEDQLISQLSQDAHESLDHPSSALPARALPSTGQEAESACSVSHAPQQTSTTAGTTSKSTEQFPNDSPASPTPVSSPTSSPPTISKQSPTQRRNARLSREIRSPDDTRSIDAQSSGLASQTHLPLSSKHGKITTSPVSKMSALPRPIGAGISGASSDVSTRSQSSGIARTLSRSPPGPATSPLQAFRASGSTSGGLRTPAPLSRPRTSAKTRSSLQARPRHPQQSLATMTPPSVTQQDPAEEARRAQAAQGLSAARQLLEFDDDDTTLQTAPMTPIRTFRDNVAPAMPNLRSHLNGFRPNNEWEDSPMSMTPKLIHKLEHSGYERSWWTARRKLLEESAAVQSSRNLGIEPVVESLISPTLENLQLIARFSSEHAVSANDQAESDEHRLIWEQNGLFNRILDRLLPILDPGQPGDVLEQALVTLWELVQNQWLLFESREDILLDKLLLLRTTSNHTVVESTNAMLSLLTEVCDPVFLMFRLQTALHRFLAAHTAEGESQKTSQLHTSGYAYVLNAMGMCILKLPKEAMEHEAKRLSKWVIQSLNTDLGVSSRQAGNRVILAVQCMLKDDSRTLDIFTGLTVHQRDFATYQMSQSGLLDRGADVDDAARREQLHLQLVDGLAKSTMIR